MNILCVSTAAICTPPSEDGYGGMEREMAWLVEGLKSQGHQVDLVARWESQAGTMFANDENDFPDLVADIISNYSILIDFSHDKTIGRAWPDFPQINTYQVMTISHPVNPVFISEGQREHIGIEGPVIYYGIDLDQYPLYDGPRGDYLLYVGSLILEKRPHWVTQLAQNTGRPTIVAGPRWQEEYWEVLDEMAEVDRVTMLDEVAGEEKLELIQKAAALVHPVGGKGWVEAGAIIVLEALACGTPVICTPNGCLPEYIHHNINGFLAANVGEMEIALESLPMIQPQRCRFSVGSFSHWRMAKDYENLAKKVIEGERW